MKRQILQNVISFEKPKTVLVDVTYDYGNNKKVQAVDHQVAIQYVQNMNMEPY